MEGRKKSLNCDYVISSRQQICIWDQEEKTIVNSGMRSFWGHAQVRMLFIPMTRTIRTLPSSNLVDVMSFPWGYAQIYPKTEVGAENVCLANSVRISIFRVGTWTHPAWPPYITKSQTAFCVDCNSSYLSSIMYFIERQSTWMQCHEGMENTLHFVPGYNHSVTNVNQTIH